MGILGRERLEHVGREPYRMNDIVSNSHARIYDSFT